MNTFAALPSFVRLAVVACCSLLAASFINWAIYALAWNRRAVGAWNPAPAGSPAHSFADWLPIIGWWRLKRESKTHGNGYWIRPFLIEIIYPLCILWLYRFEISGGMLPNPAMAMKLGAELHYQFAAHFVLITLMMAATFIDFDEQTIPDEITVFGTLFGLVASTFFAALFPWWLLSSANQKPQIVELDAFSPAFRPDWMSSEAGLGVAITVLTVWALGLWGPIRYFDRRIRNVPKFIAAKLVRDRFLRIVACIWFVATAFVCAVWWLQLNRWGYLYASLMGLACGGGITWALRIIARWTLGVEALGFGDVTLMAMIGTFIGWQPSLLVFFVSPMMAVLIFVGIKVITGRNAGAYGPYLCAGCVCVIVGWEYFARAWAPPILELPAAWLFGILGGAGVLMGVLLWIIQWLKGGMVDGIDNQLQELKR